MKSATGSVYHSIPILFYEVYGTSINSVYELLSPC